MGGSWLLRGWYGPFHARPGGTDLLAVYPTLLTSIFLHGGLLHLIVSMWYLWIFGDNVGSHGAWQVPALYLMGGVVANLAHIGLNPLSPIPSIGASGAVAGVLGAYLVLFPGARIITIVPFIFVFAIQLPAGLVLGVWFIIQLWSGLGSIGVDGTAGGIAYWAHIGGFLFGLLVVASSAPAAPAVRREWEPRGGYRGDSGLTPGRLREREMDEEKEERRDEEDRIG